jgi:membrane protease YdiL (CAAX protease family)
MAGGEPITTTDRDEGPRAQSGATYLSWSREGRATLPRYASGLAVILLAWITGTLVVQGLLTAVGRGTPIAPTSPAGQLATVLATFTLAMVAVPWAVRTVLRRPGWTVATGTQPGPVRHFALGVAISLTAALAVDLLLTPIAPLHRVDLDPGIWLPLAGVAAVGFLIQTGFEELLFRGYLAQAVASRTTRTVLIIGLPALAFALPHWGNLATYSNNPAQLAPYLLMGATYGWAAWYSGSLWLPFGLHWANNTYATLLITTTGDVLPTGAPLARDLAALPLWLVTATTALSCAVQVLMIALTTGRAHARVGASPAASARAGRDVMAHLAPVVDEP